MRTRLVLVLVVLVGLAVRLGFALLPGYPGDINTFALLAEYGTVVHYPHIYDLTLLRAGWGAYPPLHLLALEAVGTLYRIGFDPTFGQNLSPEYYAVAQLDAPLSGGLTFVLKLVPILGDAVLSIIIFFAARDFGGVRRGILAALFFTCNVAVIYASAYWGMFGDSGYALFIVFAFWLVTRQKWSWAAVCGLIAIHIKPQALFFAPLLAWVILFPVDLRRWLRVGSAALLALILIWAPFLLADTWRDALLAINEAVNIHSGISVNAHNFWFLVAHGNGSISDTISLLGFTNPRVLGFVAFFCVNLLAIRSLKAPYRANLFVAAALVGMGAFTFLTKLHENYLFPVIALLSVVCLQSAWLSILACGVTLTSFANMFLEDPTFQPGWLYDSYAISASRLVNSALEVTAFGAYVRFWVRSLPQKQNHDSVFRPQETIHLDPIRN